MKSKIWLITGASSGLGKALSEAVIRSGDFVIATFRKESQVLTFNNENGDKAKGIILDITDFESIDQQLSKIESEYGRLDVLVNNAGIGFVGAVEEASISEVRKVFEANVFGTLKMTQAVLPIMRAQKTGHIVQISSHAGVKAFAGFGIYNASKFALEGFSEALAQEIGPLGIKLTIVEPGPFRTEFAGDCLPIANEIIDDYSQTAGAFKTKLKGVHGLQEGDPDKAADIILEYVAFNKEELRLPLGKIPLKTIQMKIDSLQSDLDKNSSLAERAVF